MPRMTTKETTVTDDIKPELIGKAARAAYCESIVPEYREHMWSIADIGTTEAYYREARAALEAVADDLRAEGAAQALREAAEAFGETQMLREGDVREWLRGRADRIEARDE